MFTMKALWSVAGLKLTLISFIMKREPIKIRMEASTTIQR